MMVSIIKESTPLDFSSCDKKFSNNVGDPVKAAADEDALDTSANVGLGKIVNGHFSGSEKIPLLFDTTKSVSAAVKSHDPSSPSRNETYWIGSNVTFAGKPNNSGSYS